MKCNQIVTAGYQLVRLFLSSQKQKKSPFLPILDDNFLMYRLRATGTRDNRGRKAKYCKLQKYFYQFYNIELKPLLQVLCGLVPSN